LLNEFKINKVDKYIYMINTYKIDVIICLYVDDMLILDNNDHIIKSTNKILTKKFDMKKLGVVDVILWI
jgi:putative ribosome biogenesis GTPase RsgA